MIQKFFELVADQFQYGGQKYAQTETKEATDVLFDDFGKNWLLGTIAKYCKRYSNLARERDLLKIACYMFILWLKRGFHIDDLRIAPINTTVKVKAEYFPTFESKILNYKEENKKEDRYIKIITVPLSVEGRINLIYYKLLECAKKEFNQITENDLFRIFNHCYEVWQKDIKAKGKDTDTWNEKKGKERK